MAIKILSATYSELKGILIDVEVDIARGLPYFTIVGLPDTSVKEARERVRAAIINSGYEFPLGKITINLAPADVRKIGSLLDLPIALAILIETNQISKRNLDKFVIFGELSLSGEVKGVKGTLPIILEGVSKGVENFIFPYDNVNECKYGATGDYYPFSNLKEVISFINYNDVLPYEFEEEKINDKSIYADYGEIIGQENTKRAMEISAAGKHNILIYGSTGVGKTMLAKALGSILPDLSKEEEMEVAKIYSISGLLNKGAGVEIPFRNPHHTITISALVGGGSKIKAGEVTLAHKGVLFLDELLEFKKEVLEVLREPLEDGMVHINRISGSYKLPSDFILVGSFNMCPCGKGSLENIYNDSCTCTEREKKRYLNRMSKALADRIDVFSYVPRVGFEELKGKNKEYTSEMMKERVENARERQKTRLKGSSYICNSEIRGKDIFNLCKVNRKVERILEEYFYNSKPSIRAYGKVIKLARTIADLEDNNEITESNVIEAIGYRRDCYGEIV